MPGSIDEDEQESIIILKKKWKILQRIGGGSFGDIYLSGDITRNVLNNAEKNVFVVKRESNGGTKSKKNHLKHEYHCLAHLNKCDGVPKVHHYEEQDNFNYMVMDLEGPNLNDLHNICDKHFGTRTIVHIVLQILPVFKHIHGKGIIHRDLKPDNIVVGRWPHYCRKLLLLDFGLSKQFIVRENGKKKHIGLKNPSRIPRSGLTGTVRYASINAHYGDQSRRDDLLSFAHVILFLLRGANLPWMGIKGKTKEQKYEKILKKKETTNSNKNFVFFLL